MKLLNNSSHYYVNLNALINKEIADEVALGFRWRTIAIEFESIETSQKSGRSIHSMLPTRFYQSPLTKCRRVNNFMVML